MANATLRLLRIEPRDELETAYTGEELAALIAESRAEGYLPPETEDRLARTISTERRTAAVVALGWDAMVTLPRDATGTEAEQVVQRSGFSRFPICGEGRSLVGYLHAKDLLSLEPDELGFPLPERIVRPLARVAADAPIADAVVCLRRDGAHLGRVVDADGAVLGVVALEDLLEEFVGQLNATPPVSDRDVADDRAGVETSDQATTGPRRDTAADAEPGRDAAGARRSGAAG
jgi:CBS domain containing-hemolysin-like protein